MDSKQPAKQMVQSKLATSLQSTWLLRDNSNISKQDSNTSEQKDVPHPEQTHNAIQVNREQSSDVENIPPRDCNPSTKSACKLSTFRPNLRKVSSLPNISATAESDVTENVAICHSEELATIENAISNIQLTNTPVPYSLITGNGPTNIKKYENKFVFTANNRKYLLAPAVSKQDTNVEQEQSQPPAIETTSSVSTSNEEETLSEVEQTSDQAVSLHTIYKLSSKTEVEVMTKQAIENIRKDDVTDAGAEVRTAGPSKFVHTAEHVEKPIDIIDHEYQSEPPQSALYDYEPCTLDFWSDCPDYMQGLLAQPPAPRSIPEKAKDHDKYKGVVLNDVMLGSYSKGSLLKPRAPKSKNTKNLNSDLNW